MFISSWLRAARFLLVACLALSPPASSPDPLVGHWILNVKRSHYGGGADPRREESFICEASSGRVRCTITSTRTDGRRLVGSFEAAFDQAPYKTSGIPEVDEVRLTRVDGHVADATFCLRGTPVFAYRAVRSSDGRSLTIVSVDPITRAALNSVIVYDAQ